MSISIKPTDQGQFEFEGNIYTVEDKAYNHIELYGLWGREGEATIRQDEHTEEMTDDSQDLYYYEIDDNNWSSIQAFVSFCANEGVEFIRTGAVYVGNRIWEAQAKSQRGWGVETTDDLVAIYYLEDECYNSECSHDKVEGETCRFVQVSVFHPEAKNLYIVR
jgi:hypothetical protein